LFSTSILVEFESFDESILIYVKARIHTGVNPTYCIYIKDAEVLKKSGFIIVKVPWYNNVNVTERLLCYL
jgi:hypothetical protein